MNLMTPGTMLAPVIPDSFADPANRDTLFSRLEIGVLKEFALRE